jgi:hypothetical protein
MTSPNDPIRKTTRIKVTLQIETKSALEQVARRHGVSLSHLLVSAAVERYLGPVASGRGDLSLVLQRLEDLEQKLGNLPASEPPKAPKKKRWGGKRLGVTGCADHEPAIPTNKPSVVTSATAAIETGEPVHIDYLIERWGGDKCLKARLCQLGGRKGHLFNGSITHAQKVEEVTRELDPDNLSWFPISKDRDFWIQTDAVAFIKRILTQAN